MKKFLHIAALLLLAVSCEIPFDLDQKGQAKIYVQGIVYNDEVLVTAKLANPVNSRPVAEPDEIRHEQRWDGDVFSLTVQAPGLDPVSGSTTVPPRLVVEDWHSQRVQVDTIDAIQLTLTLDHAPAEGEYYGIQILRTDTVLYMDGSSDEFRMWLTPGYILTAADAGSFDLEDFMQVNFDGTFLGGRDFQPLTLITRKQFQGADYNFYLNSFDASVLDNIRDRRDRDDDRSAGGKPGLDPAKIPLSFHTVYDFEFFRLSSDFYFYAKTLYQSNFDFLANMGLIPANFTWSNVQGGLGFVGALSSVCLGPLEVENENILPFSNAFK